MADLALLSADYFSVPEEEIKGLESVLTVVGGKVVYGAGEFEKLGPPPLPVGPDWSPVKYYGGYSGTGASEGAAAKHQARRSLHAHALGAKAHRWVLGEMGLWGLGCECAAF